MSLSLYKKPELIGPGTWFMGHILTFKALRTGKLEDFLVAYYYIQTVRTEFSCGSCREHINEFCLLENNNPEKFYLSQDRTGLSEWWVNLHNYANQRLGKEQHSYEEVKTFFQTQQTSCDNCGDTLRSSAPGLST